MHKENLVVVAVALMLCLPFLRMLSVPNPFSSLPTVTTPSR